MVQLLKEIGQQSGHSAGEVAIAWTLKHPAVTAAIVGGRNAQQVEGVIGAANYQLSEQALNAIETFLQQNP
ncbi:aldo/keto reductase [Phormidesmis sp. 146-12]